MKPKLFKLGKVWVCSVNNSLAYSGIGRSVKEAYTEWLKSKPEYLSHIEMDKKLRKCMWGTDPWGKPIEGWVDWKYSND